MTPEEKAAAAQVTAQTVSRINDVVEDVSSVVRSRVRRGLSPLGLAGRLPMKAVDATHTGVHSIIRSSATITGTASAAALRELSDPDAPSVSDHPAGLAGIAALGAAFGDNLPEPLGPAMTMHRPDEVGDAEAMAVFIHGLGGHEQQWGVEYALVCAAGGLVPIYARYTAGKAIDDSAAELDAHLRQLVADWAGTPLRRIVLIGHSMGGLVATRALNLAADDATWPDLVTDLVTLGSPLLGAPLERFSDAALNSLIERSATAAPIVALGHHRAVGIKDLGAGVADPVPSHVRHLAVVASVGATPSAPMSRIIGDGIVPTTSAQGHHSDHPHVTVVELVRSHHLSLLNHPGVTDLLTEVVERG